MEHPALRTVALPVLLPAHRRASQDAVIGHGLHSVRASGAIEIDARLLWPVRSIPIPRGQPPPPRPRVRRALQPALAASTSASPLTHARSPTHDPRQRNRLDPSRLCLRPSPGTPDASRSRQVGQSGRSPHHDPASGGLPVRRRGGAAAPAQNAVPSCASTPVVGVPRRGSSSRSTATSTRSGSRACVSGLHVVPTRSARPWPASCSRL